MPENNNGEVYLYNMTISPEIIALRKYIIVKRGIPNAGILRFYEDFIIE